MHIYIYIYIYIYCCLYLKSGCLGFQKNIRRLCFQTGIIRRNRKIFFPIGMEQVQTEFTY